MKVDFGNFMIRSIVVSSMTVSTLAGTNGLLQIISGHIDGTGTSATFDSPCCIAMDSSATFALVSDYGNPAVRKVVVSSALVTTLAGSTSGLQDGAGTNAKFSLPHGISMNSAGTFALVVDSNAIRRIDTASAVVTTFAGGSASGFVDGPGVGARFLDPWGISLNGMGTVAMVVRCGHVVVLTDPPMHAPTPTPTFLLPTGSNAVRRW